MCSEPAGTPKAATMADKDTSVGGTLVRMGLLKPSMLEVARARQESTGGRIGDILVDMGVATRAQVEEAVKNQAGMRSGTTTEVLMDMLRKRSQEAFDHLEAHLGGGKT